VERRQVVLEPEERKTRAALQVLQTIKKDKTLKRHESNVNRKAQKDKIRSKESERFADVHKEEKKRKYAAAGKDEVRKKQKAERGR